MTFYNPTVVLATVATILIVALVTVVCTYKFTFKSCFEVLRSKRFYHPMGITTKFRRHPLPRRRISIGYNYNISFRKRDIEKKKQVTTMPLSMATQIENLVIFALLKYWSGKGTIIQTKYGKL